MVALSWSCLTDKLIGVAACFQWSLQHQSYYTLFPSVLAKQSAVLFAFPPNMSNAYVMTFLFLFIFISQFSNNTQSLLHIHLVQFMIFFKFPLIISMLRIEPLKSWMASLTASISALVASLSYKVNAKEKKSSRCTVLKKGEKKKKKERKEHEVPPLPSCKILLILVGTGLFFEVFSTLNLNLQVR